MHVDIWNFGFVFALACLCALPLLPVFRMKSVDVFEPIFWASAYFAVLFVLRPIYDLTLGSEFLGNTPFILETMGPFQLALLYAFLGFSTFLFGYYSGTNRRLAKALPRIPNAWDVSIARKLSLVFVLIGFAAFAWTVLRFGGISGYLSNKAQTLTEAGQGYQLLGVSLISIAFALRLALLRTFWSNVATYLVVFPSLLVIGLASGSKGAFLSPLLAWIVVSHYLRSRVRVSTIGALVLFTILLLPAFNLYRQIPDLLATSPDTIEAPADDAAVEFVIRHGMSRFYGIDSLAIIIRDTPEAMDFQLGRTIYPLFVAWIPRQIWEDKPIISFGKIFAENYLGASFSGTGISGSPTLLGEAYLNWHVAGMLLVTFLAGAVVRTLYVWLIIENFSPLSVFVYSQIFLYLFTFWEASIAGLLAERLAGLVILLLVVLLVGRTVQVSRPVAGQAS